MTRAHHHLLSLPADPKKIVLLHVLCEQMRCPPVGQGSGAGPLVGFYRERFLNKCNQHYFLHLVWLHFSPKSNENHSILHGVLNEMSLFFGDMAGMRRI